MSGLSSASVSLQNIFPGVDNPEIIKENLSNYHAPFIALYIITHFIFSVHIHVHVNTCMT